MPDSDEELYKLAVRLVYGLDISFASLWEAMPWTWLIDWFSNVGDIINANRNTMPVSHEDSCLMYTTTTRIVNVEWVYRIPACTYTVRPAPFRYERKTRTVLPNVAMPEFAVDIIDQRRASILSSLAVTRRIDLHG
jgi:hypothetical protein